MENLKYMIANAIATALEVEFVNCKHKLNLDTRNCLGSMKSDVINTKLKEVLTSDKYIIHGFKRHSWEGRLIIDLNSKSIISITSSSNLNRVPKDNNRKFPHYMQSILNYLNNKIETNKQISFDVGKSFDYDDYEKDFKNIFCNLDLDLKEFTYYVVTYDYKNNILIEMNWYLLGSDFNIAEKESIMKLIDPDFIDLTSLENEFNYEQNNNEDGKPNKGIELKLKGEKMKNKLNRGI